MKYIFRIGWFIAYAYWFIRRPKTQGSCVILENSDSVLLVRHTYGHRDFWYFPGGGRKNNEAAETTARREIKEELGLALPLQYLGQISGIEDWRVITDAYYVGYTTPTDIVKDNKEIEEFKWWPKNALPSNLSPLTKLATIQFIN
ncbi:MAG: NUDIX hydrolase [Candidatus Saccharimonadales bacterium]